MIRLALYSALSDRAAEGKVVVVDEWSFPAPKTKDAVTALAALELSGRVLVVLGPDDGIPDRSFANLQEIQTMQHDELNAYDILRSDWVVFTDETLPGETTPAPGKPAAAPRKARATKAKAAPATDETVEDTTVPETDSTAAEADTTVAEPDVESDAEDNGSDA